jgi:hypothetical protein
MFNSPLYFFTASAISVIAFGTITITTTTTTTRKGCTTSYRHLGF